MSFDAKVLALRIRKQRNKCNMTQEHLAELANVSVVFVSSVERAKRIPSLVTMIDICNALDCTLDDLLDGFLTAKPSPKQSMMDFVLSESTAAERIFLAKLLSIMQDYLNDTL